MLLLVTGDIGFTVKEKQRTYCKKYEGLRNVLHHLGGTMMGWTYEKRVEEGKRIRLEKKMHDNKDKRNNRF